MGQLTYPDYGVYPSQVISPEGDLGEIAAKLAHPRFRREGRILSFADCSPGLDGWILDHDIIIEYAPFLTSGPGAVSGNASLKCQNSDTGTSALLKFLPVTLNRRMGFEFMVSFNDNNTLLVAELCYWQGLTALIGRMKIDTGTGWLYYQNGAGYQQIDQFTSLTIQRNWINFKFVTDYDSSKYVRFYINNNEYTLGTELRSEDTIAEAGTFFALYGYTRLGTGTFIFKLDNLLLTTNER